MTEVICKRESCVYNNGKICTKEEITIEYKPTWNAHSYCNDFINRNWKIKEDPHPWP